MFDSSLSLRSTMIGQDRYRRCYWVLPHCGGIFVEGMESGEGANPIAYFLFTFKSQDVHFTSTDHLMLPRI